MRCDVLQKLSNTLKQSKSGATARFGATARDGATARSGATARFGTSAGATARFPDQAARFWRHCQIRRHCQIWQNRQNQAPDLIWCHRIFLRLLRFLITRRLMRAINMSRFAAAPADAPAPA